MGKTSAKEAIALVLGNEFNVRKSEKSYNSELGVPLTIIGAKTGWGSFKQWLLVIIKGLKVFLFANDYPKFLILEIGVDILKDMEKMVSWVKPYVVRYYRRRNNTRPCPVFQRAGRIDKRKKKAGGMFERK